MNEIIIRATQEIIDNGLDSGFTLTLSEADACEFLRLVQPHKLSSIVIDSLIKQYPSNSYLKETLSYILSNRILYSSEMKKIDKEFKNCNIMYTLIKGMPLSDLIYDDPYARISADLDLIINNDDMSRAYLILREMGYKQVNNDSDNLIYSFMETYHEILMIKNFDERCCLVEIKRGSSATGINKPIWFSETVTKNIDDLTIQTQSDIWTVLHLFANTFNDNEDNRIYQNLRLRNYFDIAYLLNHKKIDWDKVLLKAQEVECIHKIHEVLKSVKDIYRINNFNICELINMTKTERCSYNLTTSLMDDIPDIPHNSGKLAYNVKANSRYTIFDKDFKYYEFIKNYKNYIFSKLDPNFNNRVRLNINEISDCLKYKYTEQNLFYYYGNSDTFDIYFKLSVNELQHYDKNDYIKIEWVDSNYFSPMYYQYCEYSLYEDINIKTIAIPKDKYFSDNFMSQYSNLINKPEISIRRENDAKYYYYIFSFPKDILFVINNYIMVEIKLCKKINDNLSYNKSYIQEILEII